jgi:hypothetical protein
MPREDDNLTTTTLDSGMANLAHPGQDADFLYNIKRCPLKWLIHQKDTTIQKGLVIDSRM